MHFSQNRAGALGLVCAAVLACSSAAAAQQTAPSVAALDTLSRVRFVAPTVVSTREPVTGRVLQLTDTSLTVRWDQAPQDEPLVVPFRSITSLDLSQGRVSGRTGRVRSARIGAGVGAGIGFVSGFGYSMSSFAHRKTFRNAIPVWFYGMGIGIGVGTGLGTLLGSHGFERWQHITLPSTTVALSGEGGAVVDVSIRTRRTATR